MHQQLATSLVAAGNRVLFIENTGVRAPRLGDVGRVRERIGNWLKSTRGFRTVQPELTVFSPLFLPFPYSKLAGWINRFMLSRAVGKWMRVARFHDPVVITFLPTPLAQALIRDVYPVLVVYYCANDMAGSSPAVRKLRRWEDELFARADLVFAISEGIRERAATFSKHVYFFPPGVNFAQFSAARGNAAVPADLAGLPHPVVGYVGALSGVLDQDLLLKLASQMPTATVALVGPPYADVSRLATCSNIKLFGLRPHDEVPAYIKGFDVALIPYVRTPFTDSVYTCKLNEYLAMGTPVVATNLREVRNYVERHGEVVAIGNDADDFIKKVESACAGGAGGIEQRIAAARANSWEERFSGLSEVVERHLQERMLGEKSWQDRLVGYYRTNRIYLMTRIAVLAIAYAAVFHTPLVWFAGNHLVPREAPRPADAIVIFGGHGDNDSDYQQRTKDALWLYKGGFARLVIVSSSVRKTLPEAEIMKAIIMAEGIPAEDIVLDPYPPPNTYGNVQLASQVLAQRKMKSILLVTAPYHMRRALMTWKKVSPGIDVVAVSNSDSPPAAPQWNATIAQIKRIGYEYAAIAYNWVRGRV